MIKLIVGGFKSIRERTEIPIAPLTFLFGPNSAGKSAVLAALDELSKKLVEKTEDEAPFARALRRFLGTSDAHQHPPEAEEKEPNRSRVILGLEIDPFPSGATSFDGAIDDARRMALDRYRALDGSCLRLEYIDAGSHFLGTVRIDGKDLIEFVDASTYLATIPEGNALPGDGSMIGMNRASLFSPQRWDALVLHTEHPFWARSELATKFAELKILADKSHDFFIREAISIDVGSLVIRTSTDLFHAHGWGDQEQSERSLRDILMHGAAGESAERTAVRMELREVMLAVDLICASVSFLVYQMRYIAHKELKFARVVGDRKVLADEDVTTEFNLPRTGDDLIGPLVHNYAAWLGVLGAGDGVAASQVLATARERDDFVNETFRHNFFPARGYQIKPEVSQITTTLLLDRAGYQWGDVDERLKVSLFLEDANGRALDFSDVGSGVSYVLPVLDPGTLGAP